MLQYISKSILLLLLSVVICCVLYTLGLWAIGQSVFPFLANGSFLQGPEGTVVGSRLIAQPFTKDEYFQPRPSAASYDASASAASTLAASNYALRDRVSRMLGPVVKYRNGSKAGHPVAPDIESWFQKDVFQGSPHIVAQWADMHNSLASQWVKADPKNGLYVDSWAQTHSAIVGQWIKDHTSTPQPKSADLAVVFFENFSNEHPGRFPSAVTHTGADGKTKTTIEPVMDGSDIQSIFFDLWRQEHPDADIQDIPADMVTASGSGLDPHITLQNAEYQLDRVAAKWAADTKRDVHEVREEIKGILQVNSSAAFGGFAGEKFVNVLEVNLELRKLYGVPLSITTGK